MKLTNRDAQRLLIALRSVEAGGETKLAGQARMNIAININRLMPVVAAFETSIEKRKLDQVPGADARSANVAIQKEIMDLADASQDHTLITMGFADLDLDNNPKITSDQIASLAPILRDLEAKAA